MTAIIDQGHVTFEISEKGIAKIEFGHPLSNSMPGKLLRKLADTITELGNNSTVKVIVLQSAGEKAFCAGASFDELIAVKNLEEGRIFFSGFANVINACRKCPKLIIGRVHGKAVGGGVGIAASVDYCYATKGADVKLSELAVSFGKFSLKRSAELSLFQDASSRNPSSLIVPSAFRTFRRNASAGSPVADRYEKQEQNRSSTR